MIQSGKWYGKFRCGGEQIKRCLNVSAENGRNKRIAQKALDQLIQQYNGLKANKDQLLLFDYLDYWLTRTKSIYKPTTWESYDKTVQGKIKKYFSHSQKLIALNSSDLTNYFRYLSEHGRSDGGGGLGKKSVKNIRTVLSAAFDYAVDNKYILENPVSKSKMPAFAEEIQKEIAIYNEDELRFLLRTAKEQDSHIYVFLLLVCFTGLRKGELHGLKWKDVLFERQELRVKTSRSGSRAATTSLLTTPKTDKGFRFIPINNIVVEALQDEKDKQEQYLSLLNAECNISNEYVIRNIYGKPYSNLSAINRVVNRLEKKAGLHHVTIHGLRHSVASILDDKGEEIQNITRLLGHESVLTTERNYISRSRKAKSSTIQKLSDAIALE